MKEEELTEEQVYEWLQNHKKIFYRFVEDPKYSGPIRTWGFKVDYQEYTDEIPFREKFRIGPGKYWDAYYTCCAWYTRIEQTPYNYSTKNPYDKYYTIYISWKNPQLVELEKENEKFKEEIRKSQHTHWWK